jgi:predicted anti-sigma-YlaC factor YlaD
MNCRRFQHRLYEYLDGSLSRGAQAAAQRHLSGCAACREALRAERQVAQSLSDKFRRTTDSLQLPPEVQHRVLAALADQRPDPAEEPGSVFFWGRWAWPVGLAASVLVLLAGVFLHVRAPGPQTGPTQPHLVGSGIQVQFSYVVPAYTFHQEGGLVVDTLTYQTNVVNERLPAELARLK